MQEAYLTVPAKDVANLRQALSALSQDIENSQLVRIVKIDHGKMSAQPGGAGDLLAAVADTPEGVRGYVVQRLLNGFGNFVKQQRIARGWTLDQLAEVVGTTAPQISLLERSMGKRGPSLEMVARILLAFDLELDFGSDLGVKTPTSAPKHEVTVNLS